MSPFSFAGSDSTSTQQAGDKKREDGDRGGAIIRGRRLFQMFPSKGGDYSREEINRGTAIIRGNTVPQFRRD